MAMVEMYMSGVIGEDIKAVDVRKGLASAAGAAVEILINSPGGSAFEAIEIVEVMEKYAGLMTAKIILAASAASYISTFADRVEVTSDSVYMIHYSAGGTWGPASDHEKTIEVLRRLDDRLVAAYVRRSGKSEVKIRELMAAESFFFGKEIVDEGFADVLIGDNEGADRDETIADARARVVAAWHRPTEEEIAAFGGKLSVTAEDLKAARAAGMTVEEYIAVMPEYERVPITDDERNTAMRMNITVPQLRRYRNG